MLIGARLVPMLGISCIVADETVAMGAAVDRGILLRTLYHFRLEFLARNPRV